MYKRQDVNIVRFGAVADTVGAGDDNVDGVDIVHVSVVDTAGGGVCWC